MGYKDALQIEESDNCLVVLRDGHKLAGHMRKWSQFCRGQHEGTADNVMIWCLLTAGPKGARKLTWTRDGCYRLSGAASQFDIMDFQIGSRPG